jgi:hypothetical protein
VENPFFVSIYLIEEQYRGQGGGPGWQGRLDAGHSFPIGVIIMMQPAFIWEKL